MDCQRCFSSRQRLSPQSSSVDTYKLKVGREERKHLHGLFVYRLKSDYGAPTNAMFINKQGNTKHVKRIDVLCIRSGDIDKTILRILVNVSYTCISFLSIKGGVFRYLMSHIYNS